MTQKTLNFMEQYRKSLKICRAIHKKQPCMEFFFIKTQGQNRSKAGGAVYGKT